jgi:hypothetical protein
MPRGGGVRLPSPLSRGEVCTSSPRRPGPAPASRRDSAAPHARSAPSLLPRPVERQSHPTGASRRGRAIPRLANSNARRARRDRRQPRRSAHGLQCGRVALSTRQPAHTQSSHHGAAPGTLLLPALASGQPLSPRAIWAARRRSGWRIVWATFLVALPIQIVAVLLVVAAEATQLCTEKCSGIRAHAWPIVMSAEVTALSLIYHRRLASGTATRRPA